MHLWQRWDVLDATQAAAELFFEERDIEPTLLDDENLPMFFKEAGHALRLILREPEVLLFATLQWATLALTYMMWTGIFGWVPSYWFGAAMQSGVSSAVALAFGSAVFIIVWTAVIFVLTAYPLSLFNAAMVAAHFLRHADQRSTVWRCLTLAAHSASRLWLFTMIDALKSIAGFLSQLPRRRPWLNLPVSREDLPSYYAWKIGTMMMVPALVAGRDYRAAAKDSLYLLYDKPSRTVNTRMGYAMLCGIFGVTTFIAAPILLLVLTSGSYWPYRSLAISAGTFLLTFGVITVLLRPLFLVIAANHYTEAVAIDPTSVAMAASRQRNLTKLLLPLATFIVMAALLLKDEIGFLVGRDLDAWRRQLLGF